MISAPVLVLVVTALLSASVLPPPGGPTVGPGNGILAPTWISFTLPASSTVTFTLNNPFTGSALYTWAAGLRMTGGSFDHNIRWSIEYTYGEKETAFTYRWYSGEADWLSLEFVTPASPSGTFVFLKVTNGEATSRTMEYTHLGRIVQNPRARGADIVLTGTTTLNPSSGLTGVDWQVGQVTTLAADTLYVFNVRVYLVNDPDATQLVAWLWRCYRATTDPAVPSSIGQSRHVERWGDDSWTNMIWATRNANSYCGLWINNWDPNSQQFAWVIRYYAAGPVTRVTEDDHEAGTCVTLPAGSTLDSTQKVLAAGKRYVAWGRVVLANGLNGDVDHKTAAYSGLLDTGTGGDGVRQGYKIRFWTDFRGTYNPWEEGVTLSYSATLTQDDVIHIVNEDTVSRQFCYSSNAVSF